MTSHSQALSTTSGPLQVVFPGPIPFRQYLVVMYPGTTHKVLGCVPTEADISAGKITLKFEKPKLDKADIISVEVLVEGESGFDTVVFDSWLLPVNTE